jgi:hypothetical protein
MVDSLISFATIKFTMSNQEHPMSSSLTASLQSPEANVATNINSAANGSFAFLTHSQETVAKEQPPDIDNKKLVRQKRRRTRYVVTLFPWNRLRCGPLPHITRARFRCSMKKNMGC